MKKDQAFVTNHINRVPFRISITALLSWITVMVVIGMFWAGVAVVYKKDYIPHTVAKIEHKEKKFIAAHKALQKKLTGIRSLV